MDIAPLINCLGKVVRKGQSSRVLAGINTLEEGQVKLSFRRPNRLFAWGCQLYEETTFPELRVALAQAKTD